MADRKVAFHFYFFRSDVANTVYRNYLDCFRYKGNAVGTNYALRLRAPINILASGTPYVVKRASSDIRQCTLV